MRTDLPLDALEMALWQRGRQRPVQPGTLIHHSGRGCQCVSFRYTTRLTDLGVTASVGSVADSYDNAMAEALNATFKTELIHRRTWRTRDQVEYARMGRLVQPPPAAHRNRRRSTGRVRDHLPSFTQHTGANRRQLERTPPNPVDSTAADDRWRRGGQPRIP